jgi:anti-sigma factor RsiW
MKYIDALSAYLDGEAGPDKRAEVERHLASCAACVERMESLRSLKHAVARLEERAAPPGAVHARIEDLRFRPRRRSRRLLTGLAAAVASAVLAALVLVLAWLRPDTHPPLYDELIADHVRYAPEAMPAEVASQDPFEVRRLFAGQIPFEPVVPAMAGARLLGGRVCKIDGRKTQLLFYALGDRALSLYVSDRPLADRDCHSARGHRVCGHRRGRLSLMLVGDAPEGELSALLDNASF